MQRYKTFLYEGLQAFLIVAGYFDKKHLKKNFQPANTLAG
jgi:hypothetical protein